MRPILSYRLILIALEKLAAAVCGATPARCSRGPDDNAAELWISLDKYATRLVHELGIISSRHYGLKVPTAWPSIRLSGGGGAGYRGALAAEAPRRRRITSTVGVWKSLPQEEGA